MRTVMKAATVALLGTFLTTSPVSSARGELATTLVTLSYAAQGLALLLNLGSSGENPVAKAVVGNRRLLVATMKRLDSYHEAIASLSVQVGALPAQMKRTVEAAFSAEAARRINGAILNVRTDLAALGELDDPEGWIGNAQSRLQRLQDVAALALQSPDDAAIAVAVISALEFEQILILMQQQSEQNLRINIRSRVRVYAARLEKMLDANRKGSLARLIAERQAEIGKAVYQLRRIDRSLAHSPLPLYVRQSAGPGAPGPRAICYEDNLWRVSPHVQKARERAEAVHRKAYACPKTARTCPSEAQDLLLRSYRYIEGLVRHTLFVIQAWEESRPPHSAPKYYQASPKRAFLYVDNRFYRVDPVPFRESDRYFHAVLQHRVDGVRRGDFAEVHPSEIPAPRLGERDMPWVYAQARAKSVSRIQRIVSNAPDSLTTVCTF